MMGNIFSSINLYKTHIYHIFHANQKNWMQDSYYDIFFIGGKINEQIN